MATAMMKSVGVWCKVVVVVVVVDDASRQIVWKYVSYVECVGFVGECFVKEYSIHIVAHAHILGSHAG